MGKLVHVSELTELPTDVTVVLCIGALWHNRAVTPQPPATHLAGEARTSLNPYAWY